jgi:hypothetical protein
MDDMAKKLMEDNAKKEAEEAEAAKKAEEEAAAAAAAEAAKTDEEKEAERVAAEEAAAAEAAKTDEEKEAERVAAEEAAAAEAAKTDEEKAAEAKAAEEAEAAKKAAEGVDPYPDVSLPANARGKSAEAFATVKQRFAADLSKRDEEIATLKTQVEQAQAKLSDPIPEELKQEVESLRLFKAKLDLQADPEFTKKYTGKVDQLNEFIYAQLKESGTIGDEHIEKIRGLGGFDKVQYEDILAKEKNPNVVRVVQSKLDEIAVLNFEKSRALEVAKGDVEKYVKEQQETYEKNLTSHHDATNAELEKLYASKMEWLKDPELPATADATAKALHADTIKFNAEVKQNLAVALTDDSPTM